MATFEHLLVERDGAVVRLTLNRPGVRNAFNDRLVEELHEWADSTTRDPGGVRVVVLAGTGKAFCAGADLSWMSRYADASREENLRDAQGLAAMFDALDRLPLALVGRVHGAAVGGGTGLVAVCDCAVADQTAAFAFTEVKLGLVPSVISPYVLAKIGRSAARELFLSGARFSAEHARAIGLVHEVVPPADLDAAVARRVAELLTAGPDAVAAAKRLIGRVWPLAPEEAAELTADAIATRRVSAEGREGMQAFLEKRRPRWYGPSE
jgi:methylglutaconyl-CoA hydratase